MKRLAFIFALLSVLAVDAFSQGAPKARYQIRRGTYANIPSSGGLLPYEPFFVTDSTWFIIGDTVNGSYTYHRIGDTGDLLDSIAVLRALTGDVRYLTVPEIGAGTTGAGWVTTAYNINFYPFNVGQSFTPDSVVWYLLSSNAATDSFRVGIYSLAGAVQCTTALQTHGSTSSNIRLAQAFTSSPTLSPGTYLLAWQHNTTSPPSVDIINTTAFFRVAQTKGWAGTIAASGGQSFPATLSGAGVYQTAANAPILILIGE